MGSGVSSRPSPLAVCPETMEPDHAPSSNTADTSVSCGDSDRPNFKKQLPRDESGSASEEHASQVNRGVKEASDTATLAPVLLNSRMSKPSKMHMPPEVPEADRNDKRGSNTKRRLSVISSFDDSKLEGRSTPPSQVKDRPDSQQSFQSDSHACITDSSRHSLTGLDLMGLQDNATSAFHRRRLTLVSIGGTEGGAEASHSIAQFVSARPRQRRRRSSMLSEASSQSQVSNQPNLSPRQYRRRSSMLSEASSRHEGSTQQNLRPRQGRRRSSMLSEASSRAKMSAQSSEVEAILEGHELIDSGVESDPGVGFSSDGSEIFSGGGDSDEDAIQECKLANGEKQQLKCEARRNSGASCSHMVRDRCDQVDMYAIPMSTFLQMDELLSFEDLQAAGSLQKVETRMSLIFVAFPMGSKSPLAPERSQLRVLQGAVQNLAEGTAFLGGDFRCPDEAYSKEELLKLAGESDLYVWLGQCCIPASPNQWIQTITAIPLIVERCNLFAVIPNTVAGVMENTFAALLAQGWFRLALSARGLSFVDTRVLVIQNEKTIHTISSEDFLFEAPCTGHFENSEEHSATAGAMQGLIEQKRNAFIDRDRVQDYRLLRALQQLLLRGTDLEESGTAEDESDSGLESDEAQEGNKTRARLSMRDSVLSPNSDQMRVWDFLRAYGLMSAQRPDELGHTALHYAAASGQPIVSKCLAALGSDVEMQSCRPAVQSHLWPSFAGMSPLHFSALLGPRNSETAKALVNQGAKVDVEDAQQRTPLLLCCRSGNRSVAKFLIKAKAHVHHEDIAGNTPLHQAAAFGQEELVDLLTTAGASSIQSRAGTTPLFDLALCSDSPKLVPKLIAAGCKLNEGLKSKTAREAEDIFKIFLASKPSTAQHMLPWLLDHHGGMTPLMAAAAAGHGKVIDALLEAGANPMCQNEAGSTAKDLAQLAGFGKAFPS